MARIGAHLSGFELRLLHTLRASEGAAALNSIRLATGRKINDPADDPSGYVHVTRLESQLDYVQQISENVTVASSVASQMQLALDQIRSRLDEVRTLLIEDEDQTLTASERSANQDKIDDAIDAIHSLAGTEIDGRRRLDGSIDYRTSGVNSQQVRGIHVLSPGVGTITGGVFAAATQATLAYTGAGGQVTSSATFTLTGRRGGAEFTVNQHDALDDVAAEINRKSHMTGITAATSGDTLEFASVDYGSAARVQVAVSSGTFAVTGGDGSSLATGRDANVAINGISLAEDDGAAASSTVDGNTVHFAFNDQRFELELVPGFVGSFDEIEVHDDSILRFSLAPGSIHTTVLAVPGVLPGHFRGVSGMLTDLVSGGSASGLGENASRAVRIVDEALARLTTIEGRVDAFADHAVDASQALLGGLETELQDAIDSVNKVDETEEKLLLARNQALAENALASLGILRQQRQRVVDLLQQIAGD